MSTVYTCESCNSLLRIGAPLPAGKQLKCPSCAAIYTVPATQEPVGAAVAKKRTPAEEDELSMTVPLQRPAARPTNPSAPGVSAKPAPTPPSSTGTAPKPVAKGSAPGTQPKPTGDSAHGAPAKLPVPKAPSASGAVPQVKSPSGSGAVPQVKGPPAAPPPVNKAKKTSDTHDGRSQLADLMGATAMVRLSCPACQMALKIPENTPGGTTIRCSRCQHKFKPPWSETADTPDKGHPVPAAVSAPAPAPVAPAPPPAPAPAPVRELPPVSEAPVPVPDAPLPEPAVEPAAAESAPTAEAKPKRKRKRSMKLIWASALGTILLVVGGLTLWAMRDKGPIDPDDWKVFTPPMGHCQIAMPGEPVLQKNPGDYNADLPRSVLYEVKRPDKDDAKFTIAYINLPPNALDLRSFDEIYKDERAAMQRTTKDGKLRNESNMNANGHFGREFQVEGAKTGFIQRVIWVEGMSFTRIYVLQATVPNGKSGLQNATTFLNSLKLPPKMASAAAAK